MSDSSVKIDKDVVTCLGLIAIYPVIMLLDGWVTSSVWNWFLPRYLRAPSLSVGAAIGLSLVVGILTYRYSPSPPKEDAWKVPAANIVFILTVLAIGFVVHLFA